MEPPAPNREESVIRPPSADDHRFDPRSCPPLTPQPKRAMLTPPSRWWFASSAFPMIAGTLGPVASAFSICALVRPWRQHFPPGAAVTDSDYARDPPWYTVSLRLADGGHGLTLQAHCHQRDTARRGHHL